MKSITQIQAKNDTKNLIFSFIKLIGLGQISKRINFKRRSALPLTAIITWLFEATFSRRSLYRAQPSHQFSSRTARNILNDGRINWQKLLCLVAAKMVLSPVKLTLIKTKTQFFLSDQIVVIFRHGLVISFSGNELIREVHYSSTNLFL